MITDAGRGTRTLPSLITGHHCHVQAERICLSLQLLKKVNGCVLECREHDRLAVGLAIAVGARRVNLFTDHLAKVLQFTVTFRRYSPDTL